MNAIKFLNTLESSKYLPLLCITNVSAVWECRIVFIPLCLTACQTAKTQRQPRRTALLSSVRSTVLNSFPKPSRRSSQITSKVQLNGDPVEEIFHRYTYAMSALRALTGFMWAAEIYFRDRRVNFLFGSSASAYICYYRCVPFFFTASQSHSIQ